MTTEMKATEQYFPVLLFIMLYMLVLTFESVDESLTLQALAVISIKFRLVTSMLCKSEWS